MEEEITRLELALKDYRGHPNATLCQSHAIVYEAAKAHLSSLKQKQKGTKEGESCGGASPSVAASSVCPVCDGVGEFTDIDENGNDQWRMCICQYGPRAVSMQGEKGAEAGQTFQVPEGFKEWLDNEGLGNYPLGDYHAARLGWLAAIASVKEKETK